MEQLELLQPTQIQCITVLLESCDISAPSGIQDASCSDPCTHRSALNP